MMLLKKKNKKVRVATYSVLEIFNFIKNNPTELYYIDKNGIRSKVRRAKIFLEIGIKCVVCNLTGSFFAVEIWPDKSIHLDFYALDNEGEEMMITLDHIQAKSKGGKDELTNYQTMCKLHNSEKADK